MEPLDVELYRMSVMLLAGVAAGFLFDFYRIFRWATDPHGFAVYIEDAIFWVILTPVLIFALLVSNWIELRLYPFLGFGLGFLMYLLLGSPAVVSALTWVTGRLIRALRAMRRAMRRAQGACRALAGRVRRRFGGIRAAAARERGGFPGVLSAAWAGIRGIARIPRRPGHRVR